MRMETGAERGIANIGDLTRLRALMRRAERGGEIGIGFIGGSITQGSVASGPESCYAYRVFEWWRQTFPHAGFSYINAGVGGTTSQFGAARVGEDLLEKNPDFVVIEFSVNDESTEHFRETYEGLVRRVLAAPTAPAVLLVHNVRYDSGANAQVVHGSIGRHYRLPAVSMQSSIFPKVVSGELDRRTITPDDLHPNDAGHALVAEVITHFLECVRSAGDKIFPESVKSAEGVTFPERKMFPEGGVFSERTGFSESVEFSEGAGNTAVGVCDVLPAPLTENGYENSWCLHNDNCESVLRGFVRDDTPKAGPADCFKKGWVACHAGDAIVFSVKGSGIAVQYRKSVRHPALSAEVIVDGDTAHPVRLDGEFDEDWGDKLELTTVLEHGEKKEHEVWIRLPESQREGAVPFYLVSVVVCG